MICAYFFRVNDLILPVGFAALPFLEGAAAFFPRRGVPRVRGLAEVSFPARDCGRFCLVPDAWKKLVADSGDASLVVKA